MAYKKVGFENRSVQYPNRYVDENNTQHTFKKDPGDVHNEGTPLNALTLGRVEDGIALAGENIYSFNTPSASDNLSKGFAAGDRWIHIGEGFTNFVPSAWATPSDWSLFASEDVSVSTTNTSVTGVNTLIGNVTIPISVTSYFSFERHIGVKPYNFLTGHKYFIAWTSGVPTLPTGAPAFWSTLIVKDVDGTEVLRKLGDVPIGSPDGNQYYSTGCYFVPTKDSPSLTLSFNYQTTVETSFAIASSIRLSGLLILDITESFGVGKEPNIDYLINLFCAPVLASQNRERYFASISATRRRVYVCVYATESSAKWHELFSGDTTNPLPLPLGGTGMSLTDPSDLIGPIGIQSGAETIGSVAAGASVSGTTSYPVAYTATPALQLTVRQNSTSNTISVIVRLRTKSAGSFNWFVQNLGTAAASPIIDWLAIGTPVRATPL